MFRALHVALTFLTTLPLPPVKAWGEDDARRSVAAYPLVGLLLGFLLWLAAWLLGALPETLRGALLLGVWLLLTGALHFDGFCDVADAAFSSKPPAERQRIAKDPQLGAFALAAGGVLLLTKAAALGSVPLTFLPVVPLLSRTLVVLPLTFGRTHGSSRLGRSTQPSLKAAWVPLFSGLALGVGVSLSTHTLTAFLSLTVAALVTVCLLAWWLSKRLGGLGGDAYGALIETSEAVMLSVAVLIMTGTGLPDIPGVKLERTLPSADWEHYLLPEFGERCEVVSSAVINGGFGVRRALLNRSIQKNWSYADLTAELTQYVARLGPNPDTTVGLLTAVSMADLHYSSAERSGWRVHTLLTAGVGNAAAAGGRFALDTSGAGTVNVRVLLEGSLSPAALVGAVQSVTEARTAAFREAGVTTRFGEAAPGTTTDTVTAVNLRPIPQSPYAGLATAPGFLVAETVYTALLAALS